MRLHPLIFSLGFLWGMQSCGDTPVFEKNRPVAGGMWHRNTGISFAVRITEPVEAAPVYLTVRHRGNYAYAHLWLQVSVVSPVGTRTCDTLDLPLALPSGRWTGKKIAGLRESRTEWETGFAFPDTGTYVFVLRHLMNDTYLKGIQSAGIFIPSPAS